MSMIDQESQSKSSYFIAPQQFKIDFESKSEKQNLPQEITQIMVLKKNEIMVYMNNGEYVCYSMESQAVIGSGKIEANLNNQIFYVDEKLVAFMSFQEKKIKILDLNQNTILNAFGPTFPSLSILPQSLRTEEAIQTHLNDAKIISLPGQQSQNVYYLLICETKACFQQDYEVVLSVLQIPKNIHDLTPEFDDITSQYIYQNHTKQSQIFGNMVDEDTAVFYGQEFEPEHYEFILCRPKLGEIFVNIIYMPEPLSFVLMYITPYENGKLAIWLNNNESNSQACIDIVNFEAYFDAQNLSVQQIKNLYTPLRIPMAFENEIQNFNPSEAILSHVHFVSKDLTLIERILGQKRYLQLINIEKKTILYNTITDNFDTVASLDGSYYLQSNTLSLNSGLKRHEIYFQRFSILDSKFYFLKLITEAKLFGGDQEFDINTVLDGLFKILFV